MRNTVFAIMGSIFATILIYFLGMQIVQFLHYKQFLITFDFTVLFFNNQNIWFMVLSIIAAMTSCSIFAAFLLHHKVNRRKSKDDKINFSHLATKREAKKGLLRVEYNKNQIKHNTLLETFDRLTNPQKKVLNSILTLFKVKDIHKFNMIRTWEFAGTTVTKRGGLPIYTPRILKNRMYVDPDDTHTIIIGASGSGKTESLLMLYITICILAGESMVITDPKGELYAQTAERLEMCGYKIKLLDFINPECSDNWNPLQIVWDFYKGALDGYKRELAEWELEKASLSGESLEEHMNYKPEHDTSRAVEYLEDLANILTFNKDSKDPFWNDSAAKTAVGIVMLLLKQYDERVVNFKSVITLLNQSDKPISMKVKKKYRINSTTLLAAYLEKFELDDSDISIKLSDYANGSSATIKSIKQVLSTSIRMLTSNEQIMRMTSSTNIDMKELGKTKTAIFLKVHDEKKTYYSLVTLFVKQLYEQLISDARNKQGRLAIPVEIFVEEAGNNPPFKDIDSMLSAARSRGIRMCFILQAFSQFEEIYGEKLAATIFTNCANTVYLLSSSQPTLEKISNMCGKHQVWVPARNMYESRPLVSTDRLQHLNMGEVVIHRQRKNAFITRMVPYKKSKFRTSKRVEPEEKERKPRVITFDFEKMFYDRLQELPCEEE